jgi:glycosyltransferase involved in cell wall biosynthesis
MKIALVNNAHPFSGMGKYAFNLFERLKEKNENVKMFYLETKHNRIKNEKNLIKIRKDWYFIQLNKTFLTYYWFPKQIPDGFELYHATNQFLAKLAKLKKPCIITHMDIRPIILPHDFSTRMIGFFLKRLLKYYKYADKILALDEVVKEQLIERNIVDEDKIKVIYPGYNPKTYKPVPKEIARKKIGIPEDSKVIINVGSEEPIKNIPLILKVVRELQKVIKNLVLIRIGGSVESGAYWKIKQKLKKGIDIREVRKVPENKMKYFYSAADVSLNPYSYSEGFFFPPLESMACGTPTLVSKVLEKAFGKGSLVVPKLTVNEWKKYTYSVLTDKKLSKKLSKQGLKLAKNFTLEKNFELTYKVYEEVLSG